MSFLHQSAAGGVLIAAILVIRIFTIYRLPKAAFKVLWIVAAARLLLPFSVPSRFSLYNFIKKFAQHNAEELTSNISRSNAGGGPMDMPFSQEIFPTVSGSAPKGDVFLSLTQVCYLMGVCLLAACFLVCYIRSQRKFRVSIPAKHSTVKEWMRKMIVEPEKAQSFEQSRIVNRCLKKRVQKIRVRISDQIFAPLTYGTIHPVILLPKKMDWDDSKTIQYILDHEYNHILHFDALNKIILAVILCIHWFNPMVWVMYFLANRDMELYCDEAVVRMGEKETREFYALALIRMEEVRKLSFSLYSHFSKNKMEERIAAIMKIKKNSILRLTFAAALVAGTTTLFATSALAGEKLSEKESRQREANQNELMVSPTPILSEDGAAENYEFQGEDEKTILINHQVYAAGRYVIGEDGLQPDTKETFAGQNGIAVSPTPIPNGMYEFLPENPKGELDFPAHNGTKELDIPMHNWTEEELKQVVEDIESGKIKGSLVQVIDAGDTNGGEYLEFIDQDGNKIYGTFILSDVEESDYYIKNQND